MGAGHGRGFPVTHGHSPVHRMAAHHKLLVLVGFMLLVVATPRDWYVAFAAYAVVVLVVIRASRVPLRHIGRLMVIEVPFVLFALLMPVIATGPRTEVLGLSLSEHGLVAAFALLAKGTIGVASSLTFAVTTEPDEILRGLQRLHVPDLVVQIMGFMFRYLDLVTGDLSRMLVAMRSRGCDPRSPRHWWALASTMGALFIRTYERGERVHLAMLSRGYTGRLPR
ncbi:cobalt ECF transporter T component CbiQ [Nocardioides currus]|uniref:Cobalt ECF transporter T component CbiQ n=1 Tax=Nocardioides currus TaxID=2133958 RepID=A0A2R7YXB9_9ACTN|nr:cobalt ECF transporter T component CbiQ [Nocardioides currus]PUA80993.1 cobalt ECF transporter T component CbiQ [Nocardioides currus]